MHRLLTRGEKIQEDDEIYTDTIKWVHIPFDHIGLTVALGDNPIRRAMQPNGLDMVNHNKGSD